MPFSFWPNPFLDGCSMTNGEYKYKPREKAPQVDLSLIKANENSRRQEMLGDWLLCRLVLLLLADNSKCSEPVN